MILGSDTMLQRQAVRHSLTASSCACWILDGVATPPSLVCQDLSSHHLMKHRALHFQILSTTNPRGAREPNLAIDTLKLVCDHGGTDTCILVVPRSLRSERLRVAAACVRTYFDHA